MTREVVARQREQLAQQPETDTAVQALRASSGGASVLPYRPAGLTGELCRDPSGLPITITGVAIPAGLAI